MSFLTDSLQFIFTVLNVFYFYVPRYLVIYAFSLLVLTIAKILNKRGGKGNKVAKIGLIVFYMLLALYKIGVFHLFVGTETMDLLLGILPIVCMFWLLKSMKRRRFPMSSKKVFNYITVWVLYLILCIVVLFLDPDEIIFIFNLLYMTICFIILMITTNGGKE